ncbi:hypothetical protein ALC57_04953, partial [Trachymyrmex cornetzi]
IVANAVERLTKSCDKRASLRTESRSHSRLGSCEGQNEDWYGLENKEEGQEDSSDSETRRRPTRSTANRVQSHASSALQSEQLRAALSTVSTIG